MFGLPALACQARTIDLRQTAFDLQQTTAEPGQPELRQIKRRRSANMRKQFVLLIIGLALATQATAERGRPEVARYVKAYQGADGVEVFITRIGPPNAREVLVQINGVDHPLDQRVLKARGDAVPAGTQYVATVDGKPLPLLILGPAGGAELVAPVRTPLQYDKNLSRQSQPEHMLTDYLEQK
ncbi:hypothetical protein E4L96_05700 [Massilia arenosa]|uniref:Uncharacterized protein n=1 Tax=Zemynaea arenosa TaxID=2561931 RepID=A0A4Y9SLT1_9BURK|nr:hypothetical protein [Massilia arenosa]TFW25024.1 hypothetical protein E4L96_05700 [Massilia arenosa]